MPKDKSFLCHCRDGIDEDAKDLMIRKKVCQDLPFYNEYNNKSYCVLHYPSQDKTADFMAVFEERLRNEQYEFECVYFPCKIDLYGRKFEKKVSFSFACFSSKVSFHNATFVEDPFFMLHRI